MSDRDREVPAPAPTTTPWGLWLAVLYALSPLDALPDALPGLGLVDDLGITGVALVLAWRAWRAGHLVRDAAVPVVIAALYAALPVDLIPDVVPGFGRVDDAVVALIGAVTSWWLGRRARAVAAASTPDLDGAP